MTIVLTGGGSGGHITPILAVQTELKKQRPGVCNSMETLLVHQGIARNWLAPFIEKLVEAKVEVRGCQKTCQLSSSAKPASDEDFGKEFLDLTVAVKVVKNVDEAMEHIAKYG